MQNLKQKRQLEFNKLLMEKFNLVSEDSESIDDLLSQDTIESRKRAAKSIEGNSDLIKKYATSENPKHVGVAAMAYDTKYSPEYGGKTKFLTQVSRGLKYEDWGDNKKRRNWEDSLGAANEKQAQEYAKTILKNKYGLSPDGGIATSPEIEKWITKNFGFEVYSKDKETGEMVGSNFIPDIPVNLMAWKKLGSKVMAQLPGIPGTGDFADYFWGRDDGEWGKPGYYDALAEENNQRKAAVKNHYSDMVSQSKRILLIPEPEKYGIDPNDVYEYSNPYDEEGNYWVLDPGMVTMGPRGFDYASRKDWEFRKNELSKIIIKKEDNKEELAQQLSIQDEEIIPKIPWSGQMMPAEYMATVKDFSSKTKPGSAKFISPLPENFKTAGSGFGMRMLKKGAKGRAHSGIDVSAPDGTPIQAVGDGVITRVKINSKTAGNYINLTTVDGKYKFRMLHMSKFGKFKLGDRVKQGDIIGYVGNTGTSTGAHLHFDVVDLKAGGIHIDPITWYASETGTEMGASTSERGRQRYIDKYGREKAEKDFKKQIKGVYGRGYDSGFGPEYFENLGAS